MSHHSVYNNPGLSHSKSAAIALNSLKLGITTAERTKLGYISVDNNADISQMETDVLNSKAKTDKITISQNRNLDKHYLIRNSILATSGSFANQRYPITNSFVAIQWQPSADAHVFGSNISIASDTNVTFSSGLYRISLQLYLR